MKLVVGLGNPGPKYETTRHNAGFLAVDRLIDHWKARGPNDAYQGEIHEASVNGEKIYLVKPLTYMNESGKCVGSLFRFHKLLPQDLIVIHDDLDLKPISFRIKTGGGSGGHRGLRSIDSHLGEEAVGYYRIRIGIGHPTKLREASSLPEKSRISPVDYVLQRFSDSELEQLDPLLDEVAKAVELIIQGGVHKAMNKFNQIEKNRE